jgi:hypothetical protein
MIHVLVFSALHSSLVIPIWKTDVTTGRRCMKEDPTQENARECHIESLFGFVIYLPYNTKQAHKFSES